VTKLQTLIDHFAEMIDPQYLTCYETGLNEPIYIVELSPAKLPEADALFIVCREFFEFEFVNIKLRQEKITFVFEDKKHTDEVLAEAAKYRLECRNYLMTVDPSELTPEDTLEHLGYGRNGLGS
jgi:hypothetical protein